MKVDGPRSGLVSFHNRVAQTLQHLVSTNIIRKRLAEQRGKGEALEEELNRFAKERTSVTPFTVPPSARPRWPSPGNRGRRVLWDRMS